MILLIKRWSLIYKISYPARSTLKVDGESRPYFILRFNEKKFKNIRMNEGRVAARIPDLESSRRWPAFLASKKIKASASKKEKAFCVVFFYGSNNNNNSNNNGLYFRSNKSNLQLAFLLK